MKDGFIKIACATPELKVADCDYNADKIIELIKEAHEKGVKVICFPELSLTGYTCGDLFLQSALLNSAEENLLRIVNETAELEIISIVGLPFTYVNKLYNCASVIYKGEILGIVPKTNIPNYSEFYEARHFTKGFESDSDTIINGKSITFGTNQIFECNDMSGFTFGVEICEDLWVGDTPSIKLAKNGATIIFNLSASDEIIGKSEYRRTIVKAKSGSLISAYAYADAGIGESTTDMVFAGHNIIAENGSVLAESRLFEKGLTIADIDIYRIIHERKKSSTWIYNDHNFTINTFDMNISENNLSRIFPQNPFVPSAKSDL
ncbi:MAG: nitrilase-related carbon-nitrogen hydrolase, partial [Ruminococcus sp.]